MHEIRIVLKPITIKTRLKASAIVACILMHEIRIVLNPMTIKTRLKATAVVTCILMHEISILHLDAGLMAVHDHLND